MAKSDTSRDLTSLTVVQVAKLLGVADRSVRNWMNNNGLQYSKSAKGRTLDWHVTLKWFIAYRVAELGNDRNAAKNSAQIPVDDDSESYEDALARKTRAEANLKELQLAERRGQVASIEDVEKVVSASSVATRTQIEGLPSKLATQLVGLSEKSAVQKILSREMSQLLTNLATIDAVKEVARRSGEDD